MKADLLLTGFDQVVTLAKGAVPRTGAAMTELSVVERGAIAVAEGRIAWIGPSRKTRTEVSLRHRGKVRDFAGGIALPGFVDAHTHLVFAGSREGEIGQKVRGVGYLEIARRGGGLYRTVQETRKASRSRLVAEAAARLRRMVGWGTTALEAKSGYGLDLGTEVRMLEAIRDLQRSAPATIVPTFLGAHAYPPGYQRDHGPYLRDLLERQIPEVRRRNLARFCDVFCEEGFFSASESRRILTRARQEGFQLKIHADEFTECGGALLAAELGATSADHLLETGARGRLALARAGVTAVLLPVTPFASLASRRPPGRELVEAGAAVALGSDLSPNSWVESMPQVIAHAVHGGRMTPAEALTAATVNAAHAIGLPDRGRLVPGLPADLVVFDLPGADHLAYRMGSLPPTEVYVAGRAIRSAALP